MVPGLLSELAGSKDAALALSLLLNGGLAVALVRLWRSHREQQKRILGMLSEILREIVPLTSRLALGMSGEWEGSDEPL